MSCDTCTHNGKATAQRDVEELPQGVSSPMSAGAPDKVFAYAPTWQHDSSPAPAGATRYVPKGWTRLSTPEEPLVESINILGRAILNVKPGALELLAEKSIREIQHYFRRDHLEGWRRIVLDPKASRNDRYVALTLLQNAVIAARGTLPACQDTGTAIVLGKKGENVWTDAATTDEEALSHGIWRAYTQSNLRYSQTAALDMTTEVATGNNLPAQIDLLSTKGSEYKFLTIAKGGGSANKAYLYQETKALLNAKSLRAFIRDKLKSLGTSACPPYHLALVVGGTSAETTMKTVKLASCRYYDDLPFSGDKTGRAFRDAEWEKILMEEAEAVGLGSQFGGRHFAIQARVIRLPRHGASCPVGLGVSCSADRQILGKITEEGVFIETLEHDPAAFLPTDAEIAAAVAACGSAECAMETVKINLNDGMDAMRATLSKYPICTRLSLTGTLVVARDIAHAKLQERLDRGEPLPDYVKNCIIYYAGPAKTPEGYASGSFGPTTAGRMDAYVNGFMEHGGGFVTLAKGNRTKQVTEACKKHGGFYLGSIGGTAATLAEHAIKKVEVLEYPELGMEAVWRIDVVDFPAFIIVDDKGNDFFEQIMNKKA